MNQTHGTQDRSTTKIRFERSAMISAAHLTADDGGTAFIFCAIPGGTPQFQFTRDDRTSSTVVNAPEITNHRDFVKFVNERFGSA